MCCGEEGCPKVGEEGETGSASEGSSFQQRPNNGYWLNGQWYVPQTPAPCPSCGRCPTCGQPKYPFYQYGYPYWSVIPPYQWTVTSGQTGQTYPNTGQLTFNYTNGPVSS